MNSILLGVNLYKVNQPTAGMPYQGIPAETLTRPLPYHHSIYNVLLLGRCPTEVNSCRFYTLVPHQVCKESNVAVALKKILCVAVAKRMRVHDLGIYLVFGCVVFQLLGNASCGNPLPESVQKQIPAASSRSFQPFKRFLSQSLGNE